MGYCDKCGEVLAQSSCKCGGELKSIDGMTVPSLISNQYIPTGGLGQQVLENQNIQSEQPKMSLQDMKKNFLASKPAEPVCVGCSKTIDMSKPVLQTSDGYLHDECLICATCNLKISNENGFVSRETGFHHPKCVAEKCTKCKQPLMDQFLDFNGKKYHQNV